MEKNQGKRFILYGENVNVNAQKYLHPKDRSWKKGIYKETEKLPVVWKEIESDCIGSIPKNGHITSVKETTPKTLWKSSTIHNLCTLK